MIALGTRHETSSSSNYIFFFNIMLTFNLILYETYVAGSRNLDVYLIFFSTVGVITETAPCPDVPPCYTCQWNTRSWHQCEVVTGICDKGLQSRDVHCGRNDGAIIVLPGKGYNCNFYKAKAICTAAVQLMFIWLFARRTVEGAIAAV